jgi:hypothetical protein
MKLLDITKVEESVYSVTSLACPDCGASLTKLISSDQLYSYRMGFHVQDVFPSLDADEREQFISGYCGLCWDRMWISNT